ncbi:unnamed protein product [Leptidea sinapis]|uniref:Endonuclease/exonuclease/phosphatase domain-containing protein n=1 Tax=Leptidea sinapis TaxID=189913 RepID=A0A5E4R5Z8_9NEOP|nr:unnamed protein product [Leptidea sinapis]
MTSVEMISFNCRSVKRSCQHIRDLCCEYQVIAIQEHWLLPNLDFLNTIDDKFRAYGVSAVDTTSVLKGRPYGGVAILWRKDMFPTVNHIYCGNPRVTAVRSELACRSIIVVSVYMPTEAGDNLPMFTECLEVISAVIASHDDVESVIICLGGFNGDVSHKNSLFGHELVAYCAEEHWTCADVSTLGVMSGTYTYLSDAHGTTSWIDHVVVTSAALRALRGVRVLNNVYWSNHFPLAVEFDFYRNEIFAATNILNQPIQTGLAGEPVSTDAWRRYSPEKIE